MSVVLLRGKIGSGKTCRAVSLCEETGAQHLCLDSVTDKLFADGCPGRERRLATERAVLEYFLELAVSNHAAGRDTVIDHGFWTRAELGFAAGYLEERGVPYRVLTLEADFETRLMRVAARGDGERFDRERLAFFDSLFEE
ncbi:MAG: ATP-binding protein [Clostridia bacterium]|nr:ATP-binding protein [Clostridia bacterium]